nr:MAG TPA: hypothetical protein [Caudoviricetes sp.]
MDSMSNREYHLHLVSICIFNEVFYSMSLQNRIRYDLGYICFSISRYDKELDALSDKELKDKINSIKKPQWYDMYEYIIKRNKNLLRILYFFPTPRVVNILYKKLKQNEHVINKKEENNQIQYQPLVSTYLHMKLKYSLSFKQRIEFNLGITDYLFDTNDKELNTLSEKELKDMIKTLKAPWWNKLYEMLLEHHITLLIKVWSLLNL